MLFIPLLAPVELALTGTPSYNSTIVLGPLAQVLGKNHVGAEGCASVPASAAAARAARPRRIAHGSIGDRAIGAVARERGRCARAASGPASILAHKKHT